MTGHFFKMGLVFHLVTLTITTMTGWNHYWVLFGVGIVTIFYCVVGGLEAVIWGDAIQGLIMWVGVLLCLGYLLLLPPGGPSRAISLA